MQVINPVKGRWTTRQVIMTHIGIAHIPTIGGRGALNKTSGGRGCKLATASLPSLHFLHFFVSIILQHFSVSMFFMSVCGMQDLLESWFAILHLLAGIVLSFSEVVSSQGCIVSPWENQCLYLSSVVMDFLLLLRRAQYYIFWNRLMTVCSVDVDVIWSLRKPTAGDGYVLLAGDKGQFLLCEGNKGKSFISICIKYMVIYSWEQIRCQWLLEALQNPGWIIYRWIDLKLMFLLHNLWRNILVMRCNCELDIRLVDAWSIKLPTCVRRTVQTAS